MTTTLSAVVTDVKDRLADTTGKTWTDTMLKRWINMACKDIARRAEVLEVKLTATMIAGDNVIDLQADLTPGSVPLSRIHKVEYEVSSTQVYPLEAREIHEIDSIRGVNPLQSQAWPSYYYIWGIMGIDAKMYLYPVQAQGGTLNIYAYKIPALLANDNDVPQIPEGWEDLISLYCEYVALRRDSDSRWQDAKALYEDEIDSLMNLTRSHHDQAHWITTPNNLGSTWWAGGEY